MAPRAVSRAARGARGSSGGGGRRDEDRAGARKSGARRRSPGVGSAERSPKSRKSSSASTGQRAASIDPAAAVRGTPRTSSRSNRFAGDRLERLWVPDRASWRAWLEKHHGRDAGVWLVSFKRRTGKPRVEYEDAVQEALCFGWIDSAVRTLDDERAMQLFSPRKPRSPWSRSNKVRVETLIATGLMRPVGLAKIEQAKGDGSWDLLAVVESLELPPDLRAAFEAAPPGARSSWDAFSPSSRRAILWWVHSAKRPETRARRIAEVVGEAARTGGLTSRRIGREARQGFRRRSV